MAPIRTILTDLDIRLPGWLLLAYLVYSQAFAAVHYQWGVQLGTQDSEAAVSPVGVAFEHALAVANLIWWIPLLAVGLVYYDRKPWGRSALVMALALTVYAPLVIFVTAVLTRCSAPEWKVKQTTRFWWWIEPILLVAWSFWVQWRMCCQGAGYQPIPDINV